MKNNKFWLAGFVGGIVYFLLGWLIYGVVLMDFMKTHSGLNAELYVQVFKPDTELNLPALIASHMLYGYIVALILAWGNFNSMAVGAKKGFLIGLLWTAAVDLIFFSTTNLHTPASLAADIAGSTIMTCIAGAIIGMVLGKGTTAATS